MSKIKILAIDPGVTTGYCFAELVEDATKTSSYAKLLIEPQQHLDDVEDFWDRLETFRPHYMVCEDFEYRNRSRAGLVLFSVQLIGIASLYELKSKAPQCPLVMQKASQGKSYYTNQQLNNLGVYKPGTAWEHSMDATRHLLHWLTFGSGYQFVQGKNIKDLVKLA